jgi:hypothetical protein
MLGEPHGMVYGPDVKVPGGIVFVGTNVVVKALQPLSGFVYTIVYVPGIQNDEPAAVDVCVGGGDVNVNVTGTVEELVALTDTHGLAQVITVGAKIIE